MDDMVTCDGCGHCYFKTSADLGKENDDFLFCDTCLDMTPPQKEESLFIKFFDEHGKIDLGASFDHMIDCMIHGDYESFDLERISVFFNPLSYLDGMGRNTSEDEDEEEEDEDDCTQGLKTDKLNKNEEISDACYNNWWHVMKDLDITPILTRDDMYWDIGCNFDGVVKLWNRKNPVIDFWDEITRIFGADKAHLLKDRVAPDFMEKRVQMPDVPLAELSMYLKKYAKGIIPQFLADRYKEMKKRGEEEKARLKEEHQIRRQNNYKQDLKDLEALEKEESPDWVMRNKLRCYLYSRCQEINDKVAEIAKARNLDLT